MDRTKAKVRMDSIFESESSELDYVLQYLNCAASDMAVLNNNLEEMEKTGKADSSVYGITREMLLNTLGRAQSLLLKATELLISDEHEDSSAFMAGELNDVKKPDVEGHGETEEEGE